MAENGAQDFQAVPPMARQYKVEFQIDAEHAVPFTMNATDPMSAMMTALGVAVMYKIQAIVMWDAQTRAFVGFIPVMAAAMEVGPRLNEVAQRMVVPMARGSGSRTLQELLREDKEKREGKR